LRNALAFQRKFACIALLCAISFTARAQVTIGALNEPERGTYLDLNPKSVTRHGGLLLPHVFITSLDSLPTALVSEFTDAERDYYLNLEGEIVYNSNSDLPGGRGVFLWDGWEWKKLGEGSGFKTECELTPITAAGGDITCSVVDEFCQFDADYTFSLLAGGDFVTLTVVDARKGKFTLSFDHNPTAVARTVIVLVTSPCGATDAFVYQQAGDDSGCGTTTIAPKIVGENTTDLCAGGAVYLYLQGRPAGDFIWTRNGEQVGIGTDYIATQAGVYIVYADRIGCTHVKPDTVHIAALLTAAPDAPTVVAENNGALCSPTGTVNLYAVFQGSGTVVWYRDGQRQTALSGSPVAVGEGSWSALIEDGGCSSVLSNDVHVYLDANAGAGSINPPTIEINGVTVGNSVSLCRGGTPTFEVVAPQTGEIYTWYRNNIEIGTGTSISFNITTSEEFILRCRASAAGECPKETDVTVRVTGARPATPSISCDTPGDAICGGTATLTANTSGTVSAYMWFRSDTENGTYAQIAGESSQMLVISQTGYYRVQTQDGICRSAMSDVKNIAYSSGAATVTISGKDGSDNTLKAGNTETYTATMNNPQGASYSWTVDPGTTGATPTSGTGDNIALTFASDGTATLYLDASNACGTATVTNDGYAITVVPNCTAAGIASYNPRLKTASVIEGFSTTISITATGSPALTYQWYSSTTSSNTGGTPISGATLNSYSTPTDLALGVYYYYCVVTSSCDGSTATSASFYVSVDPVTTLTSGKGTLDGRLCYDVAQTNDGGYCELLTTRLAETLIPRGSRADFTNPVSNTQTYTFTPSGTVSNVRFKAVEASGYTGQIIESISGGNSGNNITSDVACTVVFKSGLNATAAGTDYANPVTFTLYAIYNDSQTNIGIDKTVKLTPQIRDCACCGAMRTSGVWLQFMCYNLGADATKITPVQQMAASPATVYGLMYQWGNPTGWSSTSTTSGFPLVNQPMATPTSTGWNPDDEAWGDGPSGIVAKNSVYDPCPDGFKVPTQLIFNMIVANSTSASSYTDTNLANKMTWQSGTNTTGLLIGDYLFLPAAGLKQGDAIPILQGTHSKYWTGTYYGDQNNLSIEFTGNSTSVSVVANLYQSRYTGHSIRCVVVTN
jgi:uncharacterized protein (TIGR02145 family)